MPPIKIVQQKVRRHSLEFPHEVLILLLFFAEDLIHFLSGLRITFDSCHEYFGANVKKLLTETFVKQLYLKRDKVISDIDAETKYVEDNNT